SAGRRHSGAQQRLRLRRSRRHGGLDQRLTERRAGPGRECPVGGRLSLPPASVPGRRAAPGAAGRACPVGEPLPVLLGECARSAVASRCGRPSLPPASVLFGALSFGQRPPKRTLDRCIPRRAHSTGAAARLRPEGRCGGMVTAGPGIAGPTTAWPPLGLPLLGLPLLRGPSATRFGHAIGNWAWGRGRLTSAD